ncbi:hypothetical protein J2T12_000894 [Paenibacillus anaericanus]|uniref:hypothetical protein n=1 Tax=Paenibacillus anaericanus TaxID=170367 RepID=UPI0027807F9C|nr:hypothetical protein [Paenibacillus anaericanus]MDQ0087500.1 hypothetical protein [Paenibacillus anaericanus]
MERKSFYFKDSSEINRTEKMAYTISKLGSFEWVRFSMYFEDNIYESPPGFFFRFANGGELYGKLEECIRAFDGKLNWSMYVSNNTRHKNYIIEPTEVCMAKTTEKFYEHYNVGEVLKERYNYICETAIEDIEPLCKHIENWFHLENERPVLPEIP